MRTLKLLAAAVLLTALGACGPLTSERLADAKAMKPSGNAFQTALYNGYIASVNYELGQLMNIRIAELQIDKAMMAAKGQTPAADDPNNPEYSSRMRADQAPLLKSAYSRMMTVFNAGGTTWAPQKAAEAQVAYDCWLQHEVEGWIKGGYHTLKLAECKAAFEAAIAAVEAAKPVAAAPAPAPAPAPAAKLPGPWTVLFDWNKFNIHHHMGSVINQVVASSKDAKPSVINVTGHTDTTGTPAYNLRLSQRRADSVAKALKAAGATGLVATYWVGEDDLAVPTGPQKREEKNRRAVVVFGK
ncbi:MAG: OmpA family protein [Alphaproteobacteria bacterium]|nr:OmpA family protein [Alphaproteobacteria bacterium]